MRLPASSTLPGLRRAAYATRRARREIALVSPSPVEAPRADASSSRNGPHRNSRSPRESLLQVLENPRGAHSAANAHRHHTITRVTALHLGEQRRGKLGARASQWMAEGDGAAVDVRLVGIEARELDD